MSRMWKSGIDILLQEGKEPKIKHAEIIDFQGPFDGYLSVRGFTH